MGAIQRLAHTSPKRLQANNLSYMEVVCQNNNTIDNIIRNLDITTNPNGSAQINTTWTPTGFDETQGATCQVALDMYNSKAKNMRW